MNPEDIQNRIDEIQGTYKNWLKTQDSLERLYDELQESSELMAKMKAFYFGEEYRKITDLIEGNKAEIDLTTSGEYTVMSEDALWNAYHDHQQQMWKLLRLAVKELDEGGA